MTAPDRVSQTDDTADLRRRVATALATLRRQQGLSLARIAQLSRIPEQTLRNIEADRETPSLGLLWALAKLFDVPFSALLGTERTGSTVLIRREDCPVIPSLDGGLSSRALFASTGERPFEAYELRLPAGSGQDSEPHAPGTMEHITVAQGVADITTADGTFRLSAGDAIVFDADAPHGYRNPGEGDALLFLVMSYVEP
jgi:transcriptional regulator with XRE-family HTH domain